MSLQAATISRFLFGFLLLVGTANAGLIINVGNHTLAPNTPNQAVRINVTSTDLANDPRVRGMNLNAQLGDGMTGPVFHGTPGTLQAVDFSGGIWDAFPRNVSGQAPVAGFPRFATPNVSFAGAGNEVVANGLLATLFIDTTGISSGTFDLRLGNSSIDPTTFVVGMNQLTPAFNNGSIRVDATAIPEPNVLALLTAAAAAFGFSAYRMRRWRRLPLPVAASSPGKQA